MLRLVKVAVTGGLSSGKSSVCRYLKELGAYFVSADEIVHRLLTPNIPLGQRVVSLLGEDIVKNHKIDRKIIAKKVFDNPNLLHSLEQIIHPIVLQEIENEYQQVKQQGNYSLFVAEIPLLFEVAKTHDFDATIVVWADPKQCKQRFQEAFRQGEDEFNKRMAFQLSPEEKKQRADYVIDNSGSQDQTQRAVLALYTKLITL